MKSFHLFKALSLTAVVISSSAMFLANENKQASAVSDALHYQHLVDHSTGKCLGIEGGKKDNGSSTILYNCLNHNDQLWIQTSDGHLQNEDGKCIGTKSGSTQQNTDLILYDCINHPDQLWKRDGKGRFTNNSRLYMTSSLDTRGQSRIFLFSERSNSQEQQWDWHN